MTRAAPIQGWRAVEDAIHTWFYDATQIRTIWSRQLINQPQTAFATLDVLNITNPAGRDEERLTKDDAANEMIYTLCGTRRLSVEAQTFTMPDATGEGAIIDCQAIDFLESAKAALYQTPVRLKLAEAGVAFVSAADVLQVDIPVADFWERRASMIATFDVSITGSSRTQGIVETVGVVTNTSV